jgi:hypothetical protein
MSRLTTAKERDWLRVVALLSPFRQDFRMAPGLTRFPDLLQTSVLAVEQALLAGQTISVAGRTANLFTGGSASAGVGLGGSASAQTTFTNVVGPSCR